ncbi:MAG TPA: CBS domain-containing protein [Saprospiraceae bacterium]|nr:CBS domain-containing protein [Saprospiraceae bacterium]HPG06454.1 CBS domain-containing protein [Saprospiraceae bacterium]HPR01190.1 CBS domain-containing protein [Saprospiraceae bacterium]HQU53730.1 CBS domain-containing protein [Saprospiraceae bacterium]HRV84018.1 CBS domain-containing protein [Saprospiraceae bacterium]
MKNFMSKPAPVETITGLPAESVTKYMATNLITFTPETDIMDAINTLLDKRITGAPVLNQRNEVVGMIDDKDCLHILVDSVYHNQPVHKHTVGDYMTDVMRKITEDADIVDAANIFLSTKFKRLIVTDKVGRLKGQISRRDILRAIKDMDGSTWFDKSK